MSALSAGVSGGLGGTFGAGWAGAAARGAVGSALTQGIGVATGLQSKFSWTGVAAAGVGAGVGSALARELNVTSFSTRGGRSLGNIARSTLAGTAAAMANAATRSAIQGTSFGDNIMRALPDAIGNTVGSLVADAVASKSKTAQQQIEEKLSGVSDEKKAFLASKGITLEATSEGVKVNGYRDAKPSLAADQVDGLVRMGSDNLAMQWRDERTGFLDTAPNRAGVEDLGGVQFSFDTASGRDGFTSDWLTVGDGDALRFLSKGDQTYLYMGGIAQYDALGVTARYGNFIYDPPIGAGGFAFNTIFDTVLTGGAGLVPRLGGSLFARGVGEVASSAGARGFSGSYATNGELVQSIATRANNWGGRQVLGSGPVAGTLKHGYAESVLTRYQRMFGDRGLTAEARYVNGTPWRAGDPVAGSIRLDVVEGPLSNPSHVWDYKFGNATLSQSRITQIQNGIPNGANVPILMVKP